jgi:hypothetical protein
MADVCKCCGQILPPKIKLPAAVSQRIYDFVAKHPEGVDTARIVDHVYADRLDGGPEWSNNTVHTLICKLNHKYLAAHGLRIKGRGGPGSTYTLQQI